MVEAVAFDLDGTLIESERRWEAARRSVAESGGGTWREDAQPSMMGLSTPEWIAYMQRELGVRLEADEIRRGVLAGVSASYRDSSPLIPGADAAVRRMAERWPLALASSSPRELIKLVADLTELRQCFEVLLSSEEVARGKPNPDVYLRACELLGTSPPHTVAIEDSGAGVGAAAAASMPVVLIPGSEFPPGPAVLAKADLVVGTIAGLEPDAVAELDG